VDASATEIDASVALIEEWLIAFAELGAAMRLSQRESVKIEVHDRNEFETASYTAPKIPSARSSSQTFETSPFRICTSTSWVRAGGPQDDDDVPPSCADEDLMRIWGGPAPVPERVGHDVATLLRV